MVWDTHATKVQMIQLIRKKAEGPVSQTPAKATRSSPKNSTAKKRIVSDEKVEQQEQEQESVVKKGKRVVESLTLTQLHKMTVKELREKCNEIGLAETGIKPELMKRLRDHFEKNRE